MAPISIEDILDSRVFGSVKNLRTLPSLKITSKELRGLIQQGMDGSYLKKLSMKIPRAILAETLSEDEANFSELLEKKLSLCETDQLSDLCRAWADLRIAFNDRTYQIFQWLDSEEAAFSGARPTELLTTIDGRRIVRDHLVSANSHRVSYL